jgi:hypothetical protein
MKLWFLQQYDRLGTAYVGWGLKFINSTYIVTHPRCYKFLFYTFFRIACILSPGESYAESKPQIDSIYNRLKKQNTRLHFHLLGK